MAEKEHHNNQGDLILFTVVALAVQRIGLYLLALYSDLIDCYQRCFIPAGCGDPHHLCGVPAVPLHALPPLPRSSHVQAPQVLPGAAQ